MENNAINKVREEAENFYDQTWLEQQATKSGIARIKDATSNENVRLTADDIEDYVTSENSKVIHSKQKLTVDVILKSGSGISDYIDKSLMSNNKEKKAARIWGCQKTANLTSPRVRLLMLIIYPILL